jgi:hypothetical protein
VKRAFFGSLATFALLITGCSSSSNDRPATTSPASSQVSPSIAASQPAPCPNPHGGNCLGPLPAGEHKTSTLRPAVTYTVPAGWTNFEDRPGNFLLFKQADPQDGTVGGSYIGIYQDVRAAAVDCTENRQPNVNSEPADLITWYRSIPGLVVSVPKHVTVGGLSGLQIDLSLKPDDDTCTLDGLSGVPLIVGGGISQLHHVLLDGLNVRLLILDWSKTNVIIEITNLKDQHTADEYRAEVRPIIDSLKFQS